MKTLRHLAVLFVALHTQLACADTLPASVEVGRAAALQKQGVFLLDVREPQEYAEVHAKGATLIPLGHLPHRLNELSAYKNKPVAVICRSGRRSAQGVDILRNAGFSQVTNVEGGTLAWEAAGLPVERK